MQVTMKAGYWQDNQISAAKEGANKMHLQKPLSRFC